MGLAERDQLAHRIGRQAFGEVLSKVADGGVNDGAALRGARLGIYRIKHPQTQNMPRIDRIGIAQPILDLGYRKTLRSRRTRWLWRRSVRWRDLFRPVELARPGEISVAALDGFLPTPLAGDSGKALDEARRHRRRAVYFRGMTQDHFRRAKKLGEIVRGKADAALGQIEAKLVPHRPAQPGVVIAFRRPGTLDQAAEHDAVAFSQSRFE